jgi:hypothetical protein
MKTVWLVTEDEYDDEAGVAVFPTQQAAQLWLFERGYNLKLSVHRDEWLGRYFTRAIPNFRYPSVASLYELPLIEEEKP